MGRRLHAPAVVTGGLRWAVASAATVAALALLGLAAAPVRAETPSCVMHTLPSFVAQGEGATADSVADDVEVSCEHYAHKEVLVKSPQLFSHCGGQLKWLSVYESKPRPNASGTTVLTDANGNVSVVAFGGPGCHAGENLVEVSMLEAPFETFDGSFTVYAPVVTSPGLTMMPSTALGYEDNSHLATIAEVESPTTNASKHVFIESAELSARCEGRLEWFGPEGVLLASGSGSVSGVTLDNDGNAFVVIQAVQACVSGSSIVEARLEEQPFTTYAGTFTVLPPPPVVLKLSPVAGPAKGGSHVEITGSNLLGPTAVTFGGVRATSFTVVSATKIKATAPPGTSGAADVAVTTPSGTSEESGASTFTYGKPKVAALSPNAGPAGGGTVVQVSGSGFAPGSGKTTFLFGKVAGTAVRCGSTTACSVTAPAHATGVVNVIAVVGAAKSGLTTSDRFTYS